jgi:uncharacterized protein (DUF1684 family)
MLPDDRRVDWSGIKHCLAVLHRASPEFLERAILIGGAACWFYRITLQRSDPHWFAQCFPADNAATWLSKDIDFTGVFRGDAFEMLPSLTIRDHTGQKFLEANGMRLGFAQVGVTFDPEESFLKARVAEFVSEDEHRDTVRFLVMDPVTLYIEKQALAARRNQPHDRVHFELLAEYLKWEFIRTSEKYAEAPDNSVAENQAALALLLDVKKRALEIVLAPSVQSMLKVIVAADGRRAAVLRDTFSSGE